MTEHFKNGYSNNLISIVYFLRKSSSKCYCEYQTDSKPTEIYRKIMKTNAVDTGTHPVMPSLQSTHSSFYLQLDTLQLITDGRLIPLQIC